MDVELSSLMQLFQRIVNEARFCPPDTVSLRFSGSALMERPVYRVYCVLPGRRSPPSRARHSYYKTTLRERELRRYF